MRPFKSIQYVLATISLLLAINVGYASNMGGRGEKKSSNGQQQGQEGQRKSNHEIMGPDGAISTQDFRQEEEQDEKEDNVSPVNYQEADSIDDESVSKYNFIFYFLYKFKYDADEAP